MSIKNELIIIALISSVTCIKEPELPLCPPNFSFLPQNMPLHCRLPVNADGVPRPIMPLPPPPMQPSSQFMPHMNGNYNQMFQFPFPVPPNISQVPVLPPMPMPMPMGMPMPPGPPGAKLPVIVMPLYSQDKQHRKSFKKPKKWRKHISSSETTDTDLSGESTETDSSDGDVWWRGRRSGIVGKKRKTRKHRHGLRRRRPLTPLLQYITKDGYVVFEKKISKGDAQDWLSLAKKKNDEKSLEKELEEREEVYKRIEEEKEQAPKRKEQINDAKKTAKNTRKHSKPNIQRYRE